jgi:serine phosphatase RsbU (regulator of sigma subunit)
MKETLMNIKILFFVCLIAFSGFGQKAIDVSKIHSSKVIDGSYLKYWENINCSSVSYKHFENLGLKLKPMKMYQANFGFTPYDIWFDFTLDNSSSKSKFHLLKLSNPNLDVVQLFKVENNQIQRIFKSGDQLNYGKRPVKNRIITFPIYSENNSSSHYLIKVNNGTEHLNFKLELSNLKKYNEDIYQQQYFLGGFFGILLFILAFNIVVGLFVREKTSLYYCLYISSFIILQLSNLGFGKEYLWPNNNYISNHINPITATFSIIFLLKFCKYYLDTKTFFPRIYKFFVRIEYLLFINLALAIFPLSFAYTASIVFINGITLFLNVLILGISMFAIYKKHKPAKLFFFAFSILFVSVFAFILKNFGIIPSNTFTDYGLQFGSIIEAILLTFGIIYRFKIVIDKSYEQVLELNLLKEEANLKLEQQVKVRTNEIELQKQEIEDKNKEIISSISYAKRIQEAILPSNETMNSYLSNWQLFYVPKDIVAGDFYWITSRQFEKENWIFFAVADCTGHGVPGAMMSVLCSTALNTALQDLTVPSTSLLLERTSELISKNLSTSNVNDGMDISVCAYEPLTKRLYWSGANNSIIIMRDGFLQEVAPTKKPIGPSISEEKFIQHSIKLLEKDRLILFSDGITDQFGGDSNKKFKKSRFVDVVYETINQPTNIQMEAIKNAFYDWKSDNEQLDDICVLIVEV